MRRKSCPFFRLTVSCLVLRVFYLFYPVHANEEKTTTEETALCLFGQCGGESFGFVAVFADLAGGALFSVRAFFSRV
jgi:hypothetical protein